MSQKIPSPLTLDLTDTRAFKTWLYQLWQSSGGNTATAQDVVESYVTPDFVDQSKIDQSFDNGVLLQIQQELTEIINRVNQLTLENIAQPMLANDDSQISAKVEELASRLDEIILFIGAPT